MADPAPLGRFLEMGGGAASLAQNGNAAPDARVVFA